MKFFRILLVLLVLFAIGFCIYVECNKTSISMNGTIIEKFVTNDRSGGNIHYHCIIRYADGDVEDECVSVTSYANLRLGVVYSFKVRR